jgi:hypothetical protein
VPAREEATRSPFTFGCLSGSSQMPRRLAGFPIGRSPPKPVRWAVLSRPGVDESRAWRFAVRPQERRMIRAFVVTVTILACACGCESDKTARRGPGPVLVAGWAHRTVSSIGPTQDRRLRRQDLAWMGGNRFMAAWVVAPGPSGSLDRRSGPLYVRHFNVDGNWESTTRMLQKDARAVQSLATGVIDLGICLARPKPTIAATGARDLGPGTGSSHTFRTFLAVYGGSSGSLDTTLKIYRTDWCGSMIASSLVQTIVSARFGALAGRRVCTAAYCTQAILVVYERGGLQGRFMDAAGAWTSAEFTIDGQSGDRRYIDITWNPVSRRFFVGYNVIGSGAKICDFRQAAVTPSTSVSPSGTVVFVRTIGGCDPTRGHRSSSSTDDNIIRNPTGQYLWYAQAQSHNNKVYLMNSAGDFVAPLDLGEGNSLLDVPVGLANVQERTSVGPSDAAYRWKPALQPPSALLTLSAGGSTVSSRSTVVGEPLAIEGLANKIVIGTGIQCSYLDAGLCMGWFVSVYDL